MPATTAQKPATTSASSTTAHPTATQLKQICRELADRYLERTGVVQALMAAILAGQHSLLLGPPGTAKSELARDLTSRITGARLWEILLSKYTAPTRMFGPVDVAALVAGRYEQVWDGRATTAHIGFLDEIFKCGAAALNELLAFLNERLYHPESGGDPIACPLISAITASNELPTTEESAAIYDRLLVRIEVGYLADPANFAQLLRTAVTPAAVAVPTTVSLTDLQAAVTVHVPAIAVPDGVVDAMCTLRATLHHAGLVASDRRWRQSVRLLQASAYLDGRTEVNTNDLAMLTHVLWGTPAERPTVEREVLQLVNPSAREALDLLDGIETLAAELDALKGKSAEELSKWAIEANGKLGKAARHLDKVRAQSITDGRSTVTLDQVIDRRRAVQARIMTEALGVDASVLNI